MTRELALKVANLLTTIEFCDNVIEEIQNVKVKLEIDDSYICNVIENAKQEINNYKNNLEHQLEAL